MPEFATSDFGGYLLHERIGAGGMAEIFLATAQGIEGFEKRLVIKRILPTLSDDDQFVRMFIEEAKLCVALRHPNIVQVYDLGVIEGQYYIAMEYVDGRDLLKTLAACGKKKIGFPTDIALFIVMEVLKGLDYAHKLKRPDGEPLGIIHRDVSPSNVLLSFDGEVKIGDFGIAKASTREKTATGILKGKFGYMAPEQVTGAQIDSRADIFAMGIVLYELLTGHRLFAGKNDLAVLERVRDAVIEPHPRFYREDLDPELESIVMRALSRVREDRFQNATELHDAISDYVFKNRAQVTAASLGRFMQSLFLTEPDERARRERIQLPAPKSFPAPKLKPLEPEPRFASESTREDRNGNGESSTETESDLEAELEESGDFSEQTPLLELSPSTRKRRRSSVSGQAFISAAEDWEPDIEESLEVSLDSTKNGRVNGRSQGAAKSALDSIDEHDIGSGNILASRPESLSGWLQKGGTKGEVAALRRAKQENDPTDFDLDQKKIKNAQASKSDPRNETRSGRRGSDPVSPKVDVERSISSLTDPLPVHGQEVSADFDPSEIIERSNLPDDDQAGAEPTMRFDSRGSPLGRGGKKQRNGSNADTDSGESLEKRHPRIGYPGDESSDFGTVEVPDSDMPTAEVDEADLRSLGEADDTTGNELPFTLPRMPAPSSSEIIVSAVPGDELANANTPEAHDLADAGGGAEFEEETANSDRAVSPAKRPKVDDPVDRRLNALPNSRSDSLPSRRRPIAGRRERPVLLPADDDPNGLRPSRRAALSPSRTSPRRRFTTRAPLDVVNPSGIAEKTMPDPPDKKKGGAVEAPVKEPLPDRRDSSGVTAALSEAKQVDAAIAEIRRSTIGRRPSTELGELADAMGSDAEMSSFDAEEPTSETAEGFEVSEGEGISLGVKRRQSRRRMITQSVVLFDDPDGGKKKAAKTFQNDEASVPLITSAGKLDDEGASELFGVLSKLDESRESFAPEDEPSIETESKVYEDLSESLSRVEAMTVPTSEHETPDSLEETSRGEGEDEYSITHAGALAATTGPVAEARAEPTRRSPTPLAPSLDDEQPSFDPDEETTTNTEDGEPLPNGRSLGVSGPIPKVMPPEPGSGIAIDFSVLASGGAEPRAESMTTAPSHSDALAMPNLRLESGFGENDEPTEQATEESVSEAVARSLLQPTNEERPAHESSGPGLSEGGLISESFELSYQDREEILAKDKEKERVKEKEKKKAPPPTPAPRRGSTPPPPVRPVSYVDDGEPSEPMFARPPVVQKSPNKVGGGDLRAVVERNRPVKEFNRAKAAPNRASPTGPAPATGTPAMVFPVSSATPSLGPAVDPRRAAPSFGGEGAGPVVRVDVPRRAISAWTWAMYVAVLLAVTLAVAAAWVSFQSPRGQTPILPINQIPKKTVAKTAPVEKPIAPLDKAPPPAVDKAADKAAADKVAADRAANEKALAEKIAGEKAAEKAAADKAAASEQAAAMRAAEKAKNEQVARERAEKAKANKPAPKRAEKKKAPPPPVAAKPKPAPADDQAYLAISCSDPADIRVGPQKFVGQTSFKQAFKPGTYQLIIIRQGKAPFRGTVNLVAGQTAKSPCGE